MNFINYGAMEDATTAEYGADNIEWPVYMDMFGKWRKRVKFTSSFLEDLYSERLFEKIWRLRYTIVRSVAFTLAYPQPTREDDKLSRLFERYVGNNPNITQYTIDKHFLEFDCREVAFSSRVIEKQSENDAAINVSVTWMRTHRSRRRRTGIVHEYLLKKGNRDANYFLWLCQHPSVKRSFILGEILAKPQKYSMAERLMALSNPNVRWRDVDKFLRANHLYETNGKLNASMIEDNSNQLVVAFIFQKYDVPEKIVHELLLHFDDTWRAQLFQWCSLHCNEDNSNSADMIELEDEAFYRGGGGPGTCHYYPALANVLFFNPNLSESVRVQAIMPNGYRLKDVRGIPYSMENPQTRLVGQSLETIRSILESDDHCITIKTHIRDGLSLNINASLDHLEDESMAKFYNELVFQNAMPLDKIRFYEKLIDAAIVIQRWYRSYYYRFDSPFVQRQVVPHYESLAKKHFQTM